MELVYADRPVNSNKNYEAPIGSKAADAAFEDTWTLSDIDVPRHGEIADRESKVYAAIDNAETEGAMVRKRLTIAGVAGAALLLAGCSERGSGPMAPTPTTPTTPVTPVETSWWGLPITEEDRCSPYDAEDYSYPASIESAIVERLGGIFSPYTCEVFESTGETDIEHVLARSEAHDSGMCNADQASRAQFARDVDNLPLAAPELNRNEKGGNDAAEWVPERNQCWFAQTVLEVRRKYGLTIDGQEAAALERILAGCTSTAISCTLPVSSEPDHPPVQAFSRCADNAGRRLGPRGQPQWRNVPTKLGRGRARDLRAEHGPRPRQRRTRVRVAAGAASRARAAEPPHAQGRAGRQAGKPLRRLPDDVPVPEL